ncbi:polysaccharide biosynthesis/export family protein [Opitutus sp. GAS368]|uniref:polysaccharide biosynthesis/export family protein n=1 Tax=Opitutus sp. GAS368 TaxID=1882749 RepID=UPI00087C934B|nr:polysaccharide biosynthesis/export family protein [Opitutus sp. GAS368]SDS43249.1 protein involved in polysaccharide export, contains SLBB domain of the beta-grasp fold [Opitutus sp. GAS368]
MNASVDPDPARPNFPPPPARWNGRAAPLPAPAKSSVQDFWPLMVAVAQHWSWLAAAAVAGLLLGAQGGRMLWSTGYTAVAQIIRYETPDPQLFQPRQIATPTLASMIDSVEVHARVGAQSKPPLSAGAVAAVLRITPERNSDILNVAISGQDLPAAVALANRYAAEAVHFTQQLQSQEAGDASHYLEQQLTKVESEITALNAKFRTLPPAALKAAALPRPTLLLTRLDEAREQLADLLARYTEAHPLVQEQKARLAALEQQVAQLANRPAVAPGGGGAPDPTAASGAAMDAAMAGGDVEIMREVSKALEGQRLVLAGRLRLTKMLQDNPPGYYRIFAPATPEHAVVNHPAAKIGFLAVLGGLFGVVLTVGVVLGIELFDRRLKTAADVRRVTRLPVLASLGHLGRMPVAAQIQWGFRTWTALQNRLSESPNQGLVCGITSSSAGEGRSVWVRLLAEAATQCGFRVLTISTRPSPDGNLKQAEAAPSSPSAPPAAWPAPTALAANVLSSPAEIAQQLVNPDGPPHVHIPLPGWVWNLERRKEWLAALGHWRTLDNVVILVELPPASAPESVLLAQNLPNLVWLVDGTIAGAPETCAQLETLRHARCNVVGAVINREATPVSTDRLARWLPNLAALLLVAVLVAPTGARAQPAAEAPPAPPAAPESLSVVSPRQRADWQKQLTLGPGDVLRLALYNEPTLTQPAVTIQPDGRISFLEARDVTVAGLTVDEARARLDTELANYRRAPRTMVAPMELHSKKYFMLGKVAQKGVFTLDRPMTVVEAVARAKGFETGLAGRNVVDLADLSRSFLVRGGHRAPVNFERLFTAGDLAQNIAVEPGDYFYFPPADLPEVYLLGELQSPGPVTYTANLTAARAIAGRGGLTPKAWWRQVLVVRGSLDHPQTFVVNLTDVLAAKAPDLALQPRDIVFVSARPWFKAEELLDDVATAFAQSVVVFWTTDKVVPVVR